MGDSSRVETALFTKGPGPAMNTVAPLTIRWQLLRDWSCCIEAVPVSNPLVEISMD